MPLTQAQKTLISKARTASTGALGISLDDATCAYLVAAIVRDLNLLADFPELATDIALFWTSRPLSSLRLENAFFNTLVEQLFTQHPNTDTYFYCLSILHKARLKYERILQAKAFPTIDQIGPRSLLQYGSFTPKALAGWLFWRKWLFDIDNRAGQETGYLFEPIIAYAIGGYPASARKVQLREMGRALLGVRSIVFWPLNGVLMKLNFA